MGGETNDPAMTDQFHGVGGSFTVNAEGVREQVEKATQPHPEGDRSREADGTPTDLPVKTTESALPAPAPAPWAKPATTEGA